MSKWSDEYVQRNGLLIAINLSFSTVLFGFKMDLSYIQNLKWIDWGIFQDISESEVWKGKTSILKLFGEKFI